MCPYLRQVWLPQSCCLSPRSSSCAACPTGEPLLTIRAAPAPGRYYRYSNLTKHGLNPSDLSPKDYFLVPEKSPPMESWWPHIFFKTGAIPMVYFLGQHHHRLVDTATTRAYKPVCVSYYFANLYGCSQKGVLTTPMNSSFVEAADTWDLSRKPKVGGGCRPPAGGGGCSL